MSILDYKDFNSFSEALIGPEYVLKDIWATIYLDRMLNNTSDVKLNNISIESIRVLETNLSTVFTTIINDISFDNKLIITVYIDESTSHIRKIKYYVNNVSYTAHICFYDIHNLLILDTDSNVDIPLLRESFDIANNFTIKNKKLINLITYFKKKYATINYSNDYFESDDSETTIVNYMDTCNEYNMVMKPDIEFYYFCTNFSYSFLRMFNYIALFNDNFSISHIGIIINDVPQLVNINNPIIHEIENWSGRPLFELFSEKLALHLSNV